MPRSSFRTPPRTRRPRTIPRNSLPRDAPYLQRRYDGLSNVRRNLSDYFATGIVSMNSPTSVAGFDPNFQYRQDLYYDGGRKRKSRKKGRKSRKSRRRNKRKSRKKRSRRKSRKRRRR